MKMSRMIEMITILLNKKIVTARELSERFEISMRTVYRDIEVLSAAGIPIYTNKGKGGGISLMEHYTLDRAMISEEERESLILGLSTLKAANYPEIDKMLEKVSAVFQKGEYADWIEIDFSPWGANPNSHYKFEDIKYAILHNRVIEFDYVNTMHQRIKRKVEPMKLVFKSKEWYMWGFCRTRQEFRLFKLTRIKNHRMHSETFKRRNADNMLETRYIEAKAIWSEKPLRLRFKESALYRIYDEFDDECIHRNEEGSYEVLVNLPEGEWIYDFILSFGEDVEVLEPQHIRNTVLSKLEEVIKYYK